MNLGGITQNPTSDYSISTNQITFINAPLTGTTCDIRVVTTQDSEKTLIVVPMTISPAFDNVTTIFTATSPSGLTDTVIDNSNTFLFLGGVEQIPGVGGAYTITRVGTTDSFQIVFTGAPLSGSSYDLRAITTATYWASRLAFPVEVYSIDDISPQFNGALTDKVMVCFFSFNIEQTQAAKLISPSAKTTTPNSSLILPRKDQLMLRIYF